MTPAPTTGTFERLTITRSLALPPLRLALCCLLLLGLLCVEFARAAWGRLRHGRDWEPGAGLGHAEDYEP